MSTASDSALPELLAAFRAGRVGALARAITWVENEHPAAERLLDALCEGGGGNAWRTGFTGPPGAGKSTLVDALVRHWVDAGRRVGLLAVDPSSPYTGGALLGDRVRMDRALDAPGGVFLRSMASRGSLGGLSLATGAAADLLEAFGFEEILIETVGVGQAEVDIAAAADLTVVVLTPASGDGVQAMKAGLMEAADLFVINKADTPGAELLAGEVERSLELRPADRPPAPVLRCSALHGEGILELAATLEDLRSARQADGGLARRRAERALERVRRIYTARLRSSLWTARDLESRAREALAAGRRPDAVARELAAETLDGLPLEKERS